MLIAHDFLECDWRGGLTVKYKHRVLDHEDGEEMRNGGGSESFWCLIPFLYLFSSLILRCFSCLLCCVILMRCYACLKYHLRHSIALFWSFLLLNRVGDDSTGADNVTVMVGSEKL